MWTSACWFFYTVRFLVVILVLRVKRVHSFFIIRLIHLSRRNSFVQSSRCLMLMNCKVLKKLVLRKSPDRFIVSTVLRYIAGQNFPSSHQQCKYIQSTWVFLLLEMKLVYLYVETDDNFFPYSVFTVYFSLKLSVRFWIDRLLTIIIEFSFTMKSSLSCDFNCSPEMNSLVMLCLRLLVNK